MSVSEDWKKERGSHTRAVLLKKHTAVGLTSKFGGARMFAAWTAFPTTTPTFKRLLPYLRDDDHHDIIFICADSAENAVNGVVAIEAKFGADVVGVIDDQQTVRELHLAQVEER